MKTMRKLLILNFLFLLHSNLYCQKLKSEARYFDQEGQLTLLEQKIQKADTVIFLSHGSNGSFAVKQIIKQNDDSLLIEEQSLVYQSPLTNLDKMLMANGWTESSNPTHDTLYIAFYNYDTNERLGDTTLCGEDAYSVDRFIEKHANYKLKEISSGKRTTPLDSFKLMEKRIGLFVSGIPVQHTVNSRGSISRMEVSDQKQNYSLKYTYKNSSDSSVSNITKQVQWNSSLDSIHWRTFSLNDTTSYDTFFTIQNQIIKYENNNGSGYTEFDQVNNIFNHHLLNQIFYFDLFCIIHLKDLNSGRVIKKVYPDGSIVHNEYELDDQDRPRTMTSSYNSELSYTVQYTYFY